jgi:hypothetical protein
MPLLFMNNHQPLLVSHRDASYQSIPCSQKKNQSLNAYAEIPSTSFSGFTQFL